MQSFFQNFDFLLLISPAPADFILLPLLLLLTSSLSLSLSLSHLNATQYKRSNSLSFKCLSAPHQLLAKSWLRVATSSSHAQASA